MQTLQEKASEWSGVSTTEAFAIDETNIFQKLGLDTFVNLSTNFYTRFFFIIPFIPTRQSLNQNHGFINLIRLLFGTRVFDDEEEWFRAIFANSTKEDAIRNQYEFFVQRMGGPPLFSGRRGHPALIGRHRPFPVTQKAAERWLHHMQQALNSTANIDNDSKSKMMNFFRHTAYFLVAGNELKNQGQGEVACKPAPA
ncbi:unnamed protein product [Cuscuta europaea]|uniref:Uncharacterized protein n=1 Tax=Cuscuta europaea TaxID=41803 RepID=A0A9P0YRT5_CUSEU|nr:unnamed protein product [Cuscuta europaea]